MRLFVKINWVRCYPIPYQMHGIHHFENSQYFCQKLFGWFNEGQLCLLYPRTPIPIHAFVRVEMTSLSWHFPIIMTNVFRSAIMLLCLITTTFVFISSDVISATSLTLPTNGTTHWNDLSWTPNTVLNYFPCLHCSFRINYLGLH